MPRTDTDHQNVDPQTIEDGLFRCGQCNQRKTRFREVYARELDEIATRRVWCFLCRRTWSLWT